MNEIINIYTLIISGLAILLFYVGRTLLFGTQSKLENKFDKLSEKLSEFVVIVKENAVTWNANTDKITALEHKAEELEALINNMRVDFNIHMVKKHEEK